MKNSPVYPVARDNELVMLEAENELLVYDLKNSSAFCLNETAAFVWQRCDGENSVTDIKNEFNLRQKAKIDEDFVNFTLSELFRKNLIKRENLPAEILSPVSRREAIKHLSVATMAAIPLIGMIAVPTAGQAGGSCVNITDPCTVGGTPCCPGAGVCQVGRCCNLSTGLCTQPIQCCSNSCNTVTGFCNP